MLAEELDAPHPHDLTCAQASLLGPTGSRPFGMARERSMVLKHLRSRIASLALAATLAVTGLVAGFAASAPAADAAPGTFLHYSRGYSVQHGWLCLGWSNGAYRCTAHWKVVNGHFVSLNPSWVPSQASASSRSSQPARPSAPAARPASSAPLSFHGTKPARIPYPFGQCTYGAYELAHDNVGGLGMARDWYANAVRIGLPTGSAARVGATVVFAPNVQGASPFGHVGHVVRLGANGAFLMEAMNDVAGFGHFGYRWVHTGPGVHFIY